MRASRLGLPVAACLVAHVALLASCSGSGGTGADGECDPYEACVCDRIGDPDFTGLGRAVIGPGGGVVEVTDPSSPLAGFRLEVAPGAWSECWEVRVGYLATWDTPSYPAGFVPFERPEPSGAAKIEIGVSMPDWWYDAPSLPVRLSFPMGNVHPGSLDIRGAYSYGLAPEAWQVVLPDELSADRMTVGASVSYPMNDLWSWGAIDMADVDYDRYVVPAMEDYYGAETLASIDAAMAQLLADAKAQSISVTCAGLSFAEGFFAGARDAAEDRIDAIQLAFRDPVTGEACGDCNPLTDQFKAELHDYIQVDLSYSAVYTAATFALGKVAEEVNVALEILDLAGFSVQDATERLIFGSTIGELWSCNYDCYFEQELLPIHMNVAVYYVCDWVSGVIYELRTGYMGCAP